MAAETPPKTMSSRLLTMKFMQRAANSASPASPSTPASEEQSSKRRKVSHDSSTPDINALADQAAVKSALAEEERKREEAVERRAAESGDARWVLNLPRSTGKSSSLAQTPMNVVQVGYAQLDRPDGAESDESSQEDIQPFRRYNMDKKKKKVSNESESDSDGSGSDSSSSADSSDDDDQGRRSYGHGGSDKPPASKRSDEIRKDLQNKRNAEKAKSTQLAEKRRKKEIKLNSISGSGGLSSLSGARSGGRGQTPMKCHSCGSTGHKAAECKKSPARNRR